VLAQAHVGQQAGLARGYRQVALGQHHVHVRQQGGEERSVAVYGAQFFQPGLAIAVDVAIVKPVRYARGEAEPAWQQKAALAPREAQGIARRSSMRRVDLLAGSSVGSGLTSDVRPDP